MTLASRIDRIARELERQRPSVLGVYADNGEDWAAVDLAAEAAGVILVPLPTFFTAEQLRHAAAMTGMDALYCDTPAIAEALEFRSASGCLPVFRREVEPVSLPPGTAKVTFTSGTTGAPKGVCLSAAGQRAVAQSLAQATADLGIERHLCLLPLAVLLENIAGIRAPLAAGARFIAPRLEEVGLSGSSGFDARACLDSIERHGAQSAIVLPQMLVGLAAALERGAKRPRTLRFLAVGGARVSPELIARARAAGLPAFEGYGLTECASVVALNTPSGDRPGCVGPPLPHVQVRIADDGEILVLGGGFLGYAGEPPRPAGWFGTGDLGRVDADGFLHVEGRRRNVVITSFGRNVAPEWPESELLARGELVQTAVFGEGRPQFCAVIVAPASLSDSAIAAHVSAANERLPDYARVAQWVRAAAPFGAHNGLATPNGRVRREAIWNVYGDRFDAN